MMTFGFFFMFVGCEKSEKGNDSFDFKVHDYRVDNVLYKGDEKTDKDAVEKQRFGGYARHVCLFLLNRTVLHRPLVS